jgi:hypothetical protein
MKRLAGKVFAHSTAAPGLAQFKSGKWVRVYPAKKGTFDCKSSNGVDIKANLLGG